MNPRRIPSFVIEIDAWGEWQPEKDFFEVAAARTWGRQFLPQNTWRIVNLVTNDIAYVYNPTAALAEVASQEVQRFDSKDRWMARFLEDRQRRAELLERRRNPPEEEIAFGDGSRGFHIHGQRGHIPTIQEAFGWDDEEDDLHVEKYNWIEEGF